jgi:protein-tyrosine phosphatase
VAAGFVDIHSHVIPSADDGARDREEGLELCRRAAAQGTRLLYGTPHAQTASNWHPLTEERYQHALANYKLMKDNCARFGLELRLGFELTAGGILIGTVRDYLLEGTSAVLVELPGPWLSCPDALGQTQAQASEIRAAGFEVILAHPERCAEVQGEPALLLPFIAEGALVCFNADSFLGGHDAAAEQCAWHLLDLGVGDFVASDAHSLGRPSRLRVAFEAIAARYGSRRALGLVDGSRLSRLPTRAAAAPVTRSLPRQVRPRRASPVQNK